MTVCVGAERGHGQGLKCESMSSQHSGGADFTGWCEMTGCLRRWDKAKGKQRGALCPAIRVAAGAFKSPEEGLLNFISIPGHEAEQVGRHWGTDDDPSAAKQAIREQASATCLSCDKWKVQEDCRVIMIVIKAIYLGVCGAAVLFISAGSVCLLTM